MSDYPSRIESAKLILENGSIKRAATSVYYVQSGRDRDKWYRVEVGPKESCQCKDFAFRVKSGSVDACKHILAIRMAIEDEMSLPLDEEFAKRELPEEPKPPTKEFWEVMEGLKLLTAREAIKI